MLDSKSSQTLSQRSRLTTNPRREKQEALCKRAVVLAQFIATLITVYGILSPAMGWELVLPIWEYALAAFVITDFVKVQLYKLLNHKGLLFKK